MKDSYYFPHDYHAREDERMLFIQQKYGPTGVGIFWILIEMMHEQEDGKLTCNLMEGIATHYNIDITLLKQFYDDAIKTGLFITDNNKYWSARVIKNKKNLELKRKRRSIAGKLGMASRWGNLTSDNNVITKDNNVITKDNKESKVKESKVKEDTQDFFSYYLLKTKKAFKLTPAAKDLITKRLNDGYTVEQLKKAVDNFILDDWPERQNRLDLIYCIGSQRGKPDSLEKWLNYKPTPKVVKPC